MSTVFKRNVEEGTWTAEIPCPWQGRCELEVTDSQTSETLGRFVGFSDGGIARFEIPDLQGGAAVRLSVCKGDRSITGLCRLPNWRKTGDESQFEVTYVELPLQKIQEALPGVLVDSIKSKINGGLVVGESSQMFAAVSSVVDGLVSCKLTDILDDGTFRFEVQFTASILAREAGQ